MDEHKSEHVTEKIEIGHLFDVTEEFLAKFFPELQRKKRRDPRIFAVPSCVYHYNQVDDSLAGAFGFGIAATQSRFREDEDEKKPKAVATCSIGNPLGTKAGPGLIVDEVKTGTRLKFYRVWVNGEERYFTEYQLKYAMEVK